MWLALTRNAIDFLVTTDRGNCLPTAGVQARNFSRAREKLSEPFCGLLRLSPQYAEAAVIMAASVKKPGAIMSYRSSFNREHNGIGPFADFESAKPFPIRLARL